MTIVPAMSVSSIVRRIASVAAWSASSRMPFPMNRAEAIAAASVTRTISSASSFSMSGGGEDHGQVVPVRDLDRHLVADRAAPLDDGRHAGVGRDLDPVGEWEVRV